MITQCLTIGRRPDLLRRTLESQTGTLAELPCLAVNDFGDEETNQVFRELRPNGRIVGPGHHVGHHKAVDAMYSEVETPYIFHNEDDWQFDRSDFLQDAMVLLDADPKISAVCVRAMEDFPFSDEERSKIAKDEAGGVSYFRLTDLHPQWHGYTFNPHLTRTTLWQEIGPFATMKKERHISRKLRAEGRFVAFLSPPACAHIGEDRSVANAPPSLFKRVKNLIRGQKA